MTFEAFRCSLSDHEAAKRVHNNRETAQQYVERSIICREKERRRLSEIIFFDGIYRGFRKMPHSMPRQWNALCPIRGAEFWGLQRGRVLNTGLRQ